MTFIESYGKWGDAQLIISNGDNSEFIIEHCKILDSGHFNVFYKEKDFVMDCGCEVNLDVDASILLSDNWHRKVLLEPTKNYQMNVLMSEVVFEKLLKTQVPVIFSPSLYSLVNLVKRKQKLEKYYENYTLTELPLGNEWEAEWNY